MHKEADKIALIVVSVAVPRLNAYIVGLDVLRRDAMIVREVENSGHYRIILPLGDGHVLVPGFHAQREDHLIGHHSDLRLPADADLPRLLCPSWILRPCRDAKHHQ